jgi:multidrug efflux pump subunit AcrB
VRTITNCTGENETINTSLRDLAYMLALAIAFIYLIMVAQFQSLLSPFIVMFTIPLAFTGGLIALALAGYEISLVSMLGFLVLSGVVVNNGIVFVDFTNQVRETGLDVRQALVMAGRTRIKPILMTAITTILGLSTLSLGVGMGAEMLQPLAVVSIGGLTYLLCQDRE